MGKRKPAEDEAVGRAVAGALADDDGFAVADVDDKDGLDASLLEAAGAADDKDRIVVVVVIVLCGRRSSSARRRNILVGAIVATEFDCMDGVQPIRNAWWSSTLYQESQTHTLSRKRKGMLVGESGEVKIGYRWSTKSSPLSSSLSLRADRA